MATGQLEIGFPMSISLPVNNLLNQILQPHWLKPTDFTRRSIDGLDTPTLKALFKNLGERTKEQPLPLLEKTLSCISLEAMQKATEEDLKSLIEQLTQQAAKEDGLQDNEQQLSKTLEVFQNAIETLLACLNLFLNTNVAATTWEAANAVNVYFTLLRLPFVILSTMTSLFCSPVAALQATACLIVVLAASLFAYIRWLRPHPKKILDNTFELLKPHSLASSPSRKILLEDVLAGLNTGYHPYLHGKSGVGKTHLAEEIPNLLSEKRVYLGKATHLNKQGPFDRSKIDRLVDFLHNDKDAIVIIDDIQAINLNEELLQELQSKLDSVKKQCILISTEALFEKFMKDPNGIRRRVQGILVEPMDDEMTLNIVREDAKKNDMVIDDTACQPLLEACRKSDDAQPAAAIKVLADVMYKKGKKSHTVASRKIFFENKFYQQKMMDLAKRITKCEKAGQHSAAKALKTTLLFVKTFHKPERASEPIVLTAKDIATQEGEQKSRQATVASS